MPPGTGAGLCPRPTLTDGRREVHGDLVRSQSSLPDDELIEGPVLVAPSLALLRPEHDAGLGLPVGMGHFAAGVRGAEGAVHVDFQALLGLPREQDMSPVGTCRVWRRAP